MENNTNPELRSKLEALLAKGYNGKQLNLEELDAVSGGSDVVEKCSQDELCDYLTSAYRDFGPQIAFEFALMIFGKETVDKVCNYLPYDVYGPETLKEICRLVYSK